MSTTEDKRKALSELYDGNWKALNFMPGYQIHAIYESCKRRGYFDKKKKAKARENDLKYYQMNIFDYMESQKQKGATE